MYGHVARVRQLETSLNFFAEKPQGKKQSENLGVDGRNSWEDMVPPASEEEFCSMQFSWLVSYAV